MPKCPTAIRPGRPAGHELPVLRAHDAVPELRAGERAHRQRSARRPSRQPDLGHEAAPVGLEQHVPRGALPGDRLDVRHHARDRHDARAERALELRREHRHRHAHRRADRREDRSRGRRHPHGLRLPGRAAVERVEYRTRQDGAAGCGDVRAHDLAVPEQLQVPAQPGLARRRQVQPRQERELARSVLRRRLHRSGARLRLSPGGA